MTEKLNALPNRLGHYTSQAGLLGIITKRKLWATNIRFLNDENELHLSLETLERSIAAPKRKSEDIEEMQKLLLEEVSKVKHQGFKDIYTVSFSKQTDLLSQWRGYCPSNDGYCIIFDSNMLEATTAFMSIYFSRVVSCIYDTTTQRKAASDLLNLYTKAKRSGDQRFLAAFPEELAYLAASLKHSSFEEEVETRIITVLREEQKKNIQFRPGRYHPIPYLEFEIDLDDILEIVIGPTINKDNAMIATQLIVDQFFKRKKPKITHSKAPYRAW